MEAVKVLSPAKCILLASAFAADADISSLSRLTHSRKELFEPALLYRILLSFLPEGHDPNAYSDLLAQADVKTDIGATFSTSNVDTSSVKQLSELEARQSVAKLRIRSLRARKKGLKEQKDAISDAPDDPLVLFLINRAHRIDRAGLLPLVPALITPFLNSSEYLRIWYISNVVPLFRLSYEYRLLEEPWTRLDQFEILQSDEARELLLSQVLTPPKEDVEGSNNVGRDLRGIVGPWSFGSTQRKRRKHTHEMLHTALDINTVGQAHTKTGSPPAAEIETSDMIEDWRCTFLNITKTGIEDLPAVAACLESWDGPSDVDLGAWENLSDRDELDAEAQNVLQQDYCQAALASVYLSEKNSPKVVKAAQSILVRVATLLVFDPPVDLEDAVEELPIIDPSPSYLEDLPKTSLRLDNLLGTDQPLTRPNSESLSLLERFVRSSYVLGTLGAGVSIAKAAKLRLWSDETEQLKLLENILSGLLIKTRAEDRWIDARRLIIWLWDWGIEHQDKRNGLASGILGRIPRSTLECEILRAMCTAGALNAAASVYSSQNSNVPLSSPDVEKTVLDVFDKTYDSASNGNKTRGSMKKANDLLNTFRSHQDSSNALRRASALVSATHSLSFYALALERGVPFQPSRIRNNQDPVSLIDQVLEQNPGSYTKLDDLIDIGRNLVTATHNTEDSDAGATTAAQGDGSHDLLNVSRRVTGMAIEAALAEDDFETAYSYVVNRLSPSSTPSAVGDGKQNAENDDVSWRAAFHAGRHYKARAGIANTAGTSSSSRRLEQRMELLAHALSLAPAPALPDILAAWRRCEEELLAVLSSEAEEEQVADDLADNIAHGKAPDSRVASGSLTLPGEFASLDNDPGLSVQPKRREVGRGAAEEAPMGLFEVARGAAAAFGRSAGGVMRAAPAGGAKPSASSAWKSGSREKSTLAEAGVASGEREPEQEWGSWGNEVPEDPDEAAEAVSGEDRASGERVRKRDVVANAVTGGLASGIGWVLGATPVDQSGR